jgi:hypothetical protein
VYLEEYCKIRNTCVDFKEERLESIKDVVGDLKLREFTSAHAAYFEKGREGREPTHSFSGKGQLVRTQRVSSPPPCSGCVAN